MLIRAAASGLLPLLPLLLAFALSCAASETENENPENKVKFTTRIIDGKYQNPVPTRVTLRGSMWQTFRRWAFGDELRSPSTPPPIERPSAELFAAPPPSGLRAAWIGHATVYLELGGARVLTDPIWSDRCSPTSLAGPKRFAPPPIALDRLPPPDAVVISHDHYDHLDEATIRALAPVAGGFLVPRGVGARLRDWGVAADKIHELGWNESAPAAGGKLRLTAVAARHFSGRSAFDGNSTLWASWVIESEAGRVFFCGDSGMFAGFAEFGEDYGPFDLTVLPIGAYGETWPQIHLTPEEAVEAHLDLRGKVLLPVHWGTFNLAFHAWNAPPRRLLESAREKGAAAVVPLIGQPFEPANPPAPVAWWE